MWRGIEVAVYGEKRSLQAVSYEAVWPRVLGLRRVQVVGRGGTVSQVLQVERSRLQALAVRAGALATDESVGITAARQCQDAAFETLLQQ